jgi:hypothetical protein
MLRAARHLPVANQPEAGPSMEGNASIEAKAQADLAANPFPETPLVKVTSEGIVIATGFSEALHRLLRWVPKARWRAAERSWLVPFSGAEAVRAVLPEIARLADAARDLDEPAGLAPQGGDRRGALEEAAKLLYGETWETGLLRENPGASTGNGPAQIGDIAANDSMLADLAEHLRRKAKAMTRAAEQLDACVKTGRER